MEDPGSANHNGMGEHLYHDVEPDAEGAVDYVFDGTRDDNMQSENSRLHSSMPSGSSPSTSAVAAATNTGGVGALDEGGGGEEGGGLLPSESGDAAAIDPTWQPWRSGEDGDDYRHDAGEDDMDGQGEQSLAREGPLGVETRGDIAPRMGGDIGVRRVARQVIGRGGGRGRAEAVREDAVLNQLDSGLETPRHGSRRTADGHQNPNQQKGWDEWVKSIANMPDAPSDTAAKWATALRAATAAVNGGSMVSTVAGGSSSVASVSDKPQGDVASSAEAQEGGMSTTGGSAGGGVRGRGTSGRSTWVRGRGRGWTLGRGRGREGFPGAGVSWEGTGGHTTWSPPTRGGRFSRGGRVGRGRGRGAAVPVRQLGLGGGWHSSGSTGRGGGAPARGTPASGAAGGRSDMGLRAQRETWNKVWVRKDIVQEPPKQEHQEQGEGRASTGAVGAGNSASATEV